MEMNGEPVTQFLDLLTQLSDTVDKAKGVLFRSDMVMVTKADVTAMIAAMRDVLPEAMNQAGEIVNNANQYTADRRGEADAAVSEAEARAQVILTQAEQKQNEADRRVEAANAETAAIQQENVRIREAGEMRAKQEAQAIIDSANAQADEIVAAARQHAANLVQETAIVQSAQAKATEMLNQADMQAKKMIKDAVNYSGDAMRNVSMYLGNVMQDVNDQRERLLSQQQ